jgi:hypothetical protein
MSSTFYRVELESNVVHNDQDWLENMKSLAISNVKSRLSFIHLSSKYSAKLISGGPDSLVSTFLVTRNADKKFRNFMF